MRDYLQKASVIGLALLIFFAVTPRTVHAQIAGDGLRISPAVIEDKVNPGDVYPITLTVTNIADVQRTFYLETRDISGLDDGGRPVFNEATTPTIYELAPWIVFPTESITIPPRGTVSIPISIKVPPAATPGSHFAGIFLSARADPIAENGSAIGLTVGTVISLRIAGEAVEEARIREFSTGKVMYPKADVSFTTKIENLGTVFVHPHGVIEITDMLGKKVATISVNETGAPVFPGGMRSYTNEWQSADFAFGRYQAVESISYGDDVKKTITSTTSFWVLPLKLIAIVVGVLLLLILGLYLLMRAYIRNTLKKMGVSPVKGSDARIYEKRLGHRSSRLPIVLFATLLLAVVFVVVLFFLVA